MSKNMEPNNKPKRLSSYFVSVETTRRFYGALATFFSLASSFFIISSLSVFQFGLYQLLLSFIAILQGFNAGIVANVVVVEIRRYFNTHKLKEAKQLFLESAFVRISLALVLFLVAFLGAEVIARFYDQDISSIIKIGAILIIIHTLQSVQTALLKPALIFSYWASPAIREVTKFLLLAVLFFYSTLSILNVVTVHIIGEAVALVVITLWSFIKAYGHFFGGLKSERRLTMFAEILKKYGGFIFLRYGLAQLTKNSMPWLIKFFINVEAVAFYSLSLNLVAFVEKLMPTQGIGEVLLLRIDNKNQASFIFTKAVKYTVWLGSILFVLGLVVIPNVIPLLFPNYVPALPLVIIMLMVLPIYGTYKLLKTTLTILREYKILTLRLFNEVIILPLGSLIFLPTLGILGAGVVYGIVYIERVVLFYSQLVKKYPEFKLKWGGLMKFDSLDKEIISKVGRQFIMAARSFFVKT
ncbi:MAG: oligosaccharide flippase family protein [bacterium]|nr:oligosaccharide flippase family protein [bacterium]